ncbi:chemotaxis protein CheW [Pseudorhizobium pelagicum]|uniref:Chemotaxis protein CheW n=1 Tax=Pseudorhizobium pelagicum TaxID=1509405 RepID=A0A922NXB7_9HYPH|nr:chemotaxis protein CheW [Pseudorhizobium pelagicum]KEQ03486.1 chemotaxis protein CheW [Pseudorhizobium pelagicum]KEQ04823.1 chemotaxis protein CheW [Pseudorhizobium pelagicum]
MLAMQKTGSNNLDIIAFRLRGQEFCVETTKVREIRGWVACTPIPKAPKDVLGVINLRGEVVPIVDLAGRLGMSPSAETERSAIIVAEVGPTIVGLLVDNVSDILTVSEDSVQPIPQMATQIATRYAEGMIAHEAGMICLLNLARLLEQGGHEATELHDAAEAT